nr:hypothetical protein [uncultured Ralstonia sp.]
MKNTNPDPTVQDNVPPVPPAVPPVPGLPGQTLASESRYPPGIRQENSWEAAMRHFSTNAGIV